MEVPMRATRAAVAAVLAALLLALGAPGVAVAAPAAEPPAYLRLAHLSPDTPTVDVYVDSAAAPARQLRDQHAGRGRGGLVPAGHLRHRRRPLRRRLHGRGHG